MSYQFRNITVLIVESSESMFSLTKNVLVTFGVTQVFSAYTAKEGFRTFCKLNPDLVIMDWLGQQNGSLQLTNLIRQDRSSPNPFVPIILMTGFSQKKRVLMARDSGITEFLVKPYTAKTLYDRIESLIEKPRQFVKSDNYFGPDRRRHKSLGPYTGPERRYDNIQKNTAVSKTALAKAQEIQKRLQGKLEENRKNEQSQRR